MRILIVSGFLGSGKTSLIKQLLPALNGRVLILENEFGESSVDSLLLPANMEIRELLAGCICCSLRGDFVRALREVAGHEPDWLLIEPSGLARPSEIKAAVISAFADRSDVHIEAVPVLLEAAAWAEYLEDFGDFYHGQLREADWLIPIQFSELMKDCQEELLTALHELNPGALILTQDSRELTAAELLAILEALCPDKHRRVLAGQFPDATENEEVKQPAWMLTIGSLQLQAEGVTLSQLLACFRREQAHLWRVKGCFRDPGGRQWLLNWTPWRVDCQEIENGADLPGLILIGQGQSRLAWERRLAALARRIRQLKWSKRRVFGAQGEEDA